MKIVTVITVGKLMSNSFRYSKIVTVQKIGIILDTKSNSLVESGKMTTIIMNQTFSNLITRRNLRILKLRPNLTNMITFSLSFRKIIVFISLLILYSKSHCRIMRRLIWSFLRKCRIIFRLKNRGLSTLRINPHLIIKPHKLSTKSRNLISNLPNTKIKNNLNKLYSTKLRRLTKSNCNLLNKNSVKKQN